MKVTIIAAADATWGIGREGRLPWRFPEDLARFRQRTMGEVLVMGRLTAESIGRHLPGRRILVVSTSGFATVAAAVDEARQGGARECFIAGGRRVYEEGLDLADTAEVTRVPGTFHCDVAMPDLGAAGWSLTAEEPLSSGMVVETWKRQGRQG